MINLTIRNIPDEIISKIKTISEIEKRSLNSEILILLEMGLSRELKMNRNYLLSKETQIKLWNSISGKWKDKRTTKEIINDIYSNRTIGRDVDI
jgi:hypothetical protein